MIDKVLETMKEAGKPVSAGEVVKLSGLDKTIVEKAFERFKRIWANSFAGKMQMGACK